MQIDIETKYVMNFTNSSSILYDKGNEFYIIFNKSSHFYRKCETDYCYQKKNPKRYRPDHDWWIANGWNVKEREGYKNIITEISVNSFDDISTFIFETFVKKNQPTIDKYSELVEYIDNTFKDVHNKIYNEYLIKYLKN